MRVTSQALTHPGLRRDSNEDSHASSPDIGFWVVCDGMGGHAAGEVASRVAVDAIDAFMRDSDGVAARDITWPFGLDLSLGVAGTRLMTAFRLANRAIDTRILDDPTLRGMATTAVAVLLQPSEGNGYIPALVAHVGDSRAYLWRQGQLTRLTRDHSWIEEQMAAGLLDQDEARNHPWRNLVTRALTGGGDPLVEIMPAALERGDRVLLCSDGLSSVVADEVVADVIGRRPEDGLENVCQMLIDAANAAGGPDNITVVIVEVEEV
jgi:PPM family protein phosphatase